MKEIFAKLKSKFVLSTIIAGGLLLLVTFGIIFGIVYRNAEDNINGSLINALANKRPPNEPMGNCITIQTLPDGYLVRGLEVYDEEITAEILNCAIETENGDFILEGSYFRVKSAQTPIGTCYAVYDYTQARQTNITLAVTLSGTFLVSLLLLAGIGLLFSKRAISPVKEAFEKQKQLIANASHELKTPLTIISTNLAVATADVSKTIEECKPWLDNISTYCTRMDALVLEMLELSKLEATETVTMTEVNLSNLVQGNLLSMEATTYEKKIALTCNVQENVTVNGSEKLLERLTLILLDNAIKYTPDNGTVTVTLSCNAKRALLSVKNSGEGISKEQLGKIFDRFYKADTARTSQDAQHSFGLGLSIAQAIAEKLGGNLSATSQVGEYTLFSLSLPV